MRVWIVGQKSFGAAVFERLHNGQYAKVVGVTAPVGDKLFDKASFGDWWVQDEIPTPEQLSSRRAECIINAHGHAKIPVESRCACVAGAIGYHPSLLPRHRGRSAVEWTIAMGDPIAGGSVYQLDEGWDTGPIIAQDWCHVPPGWTASDLWRNRLFDMGVDLLGDVIRRSSWGPERWPAALPTVQDERVATYEPPMDPDNLEPIGRYFHDLDDNGYSYEECPGKHLHDIRAIEMLEAAGMSSSRATT